MIGFRFPVSPVAVPLLLASCCSFLFPTTTAASELALPEAWRSAWERPGAPYRPLQIIHGIPENRTSPAGLRYYQNLGLGGVVANVAFTNYLQSEENWQGLATAIETCRQLDLIVWIYDEEGYPSGAAGGQVLKDNRAFEALALTKDTGRPELFRLRPAYEYTHASNNFHAARRFINLLDEQAVASFLAKTHEAYWARLAPHFGRTIQAFFTDEPSLMAVNIGALPDTVLNRVRVDDRPDPAVKPLPSVPWVHDLAEQYRQRYGEDLLVGRQSLFAGERLEDRRIRRQFWALIADLVAERYYGRLQAWCGRHRVASSGHTLAEESLLQHVPLDGNKLKVLSRMDIPGMDMLSSDPEVVLHSDWLTAALPASAALLEGRRRVMTEVSDFSQKMARQGAAGLAEMQATAAWQAAWGVTEFTLYYAPEDRPPDQYRAYCDFVGRLNAILKRARPAPAVLLYYPIFDLWTDYRPVAETLELSTQSLHLQQVVHSFMRLGQTLQRHQVPFSLIDHEKLSAATIEANGSLVINGSGFAALIVPDGVELPPAAAAVVTRMRRQGGCVLTDGGPQRLSATTLVNALQPVVQLQPPCEQIALGRFERDGRSILLLVNVGRADYQGTLQTGWKGDCVILEPASSSIRADRRRNGTLPVSLRARQTLLFVTTR